MTSTPQLGFQGVNENQPGKRTDVMKIGFSLEQVKMAQAYKSLYSFVETFWSCIDSSPFQGNWHIECICEHLESVTHNQIRRLLINIPPRHGKSLIISVFWPMWEWIHHPESQFLFASYGINLATRDSTKCRRIIEHDRYQALSSRFAGRNIHLVGDQNTKVRYENNFAGYRLATSVGGSLTGEGGSKIVIDDPHNVIDAESAVERAKVISWWDEAMSTRLNDPKFGAFVIIQQRVHQGDLIGYLLDKEPKKWVHVCIPARYEGYNRIRTPLRWRDPRTETGELLWPSRYGETELKDLEERLGAYATAAQLQQRPAPREGGTIKANMLVPISPDNIPAKVEKRVRWWDLAATKKRPGQSPDYTAGALVSVRRGVFYIEDMIRFRGSPLEVENVISATAAKDPVGTLIYMEQEPGSSGVNTIDHYQREVLVGYPFKGMRSTGDKEKFAEVLSSAIEAGNVRMIKANWNALFVEECNMFPNGKHDDMVDATSKAFSLMRKTRRVGAWGRGTDTDKTD